MASVIDCRSMRQWQRSLLCAEQRSSICKGGSSRVEREGETFESFFLANSASKKTKIKRSRCTSKFQKRLPSFFYKILFWKLCTIPSVFNPNYFFFLNMFMNCSWTSSKEVQEFGNIQIFATNFWTCSCSRNFFFLISTTLSRRVPWGFLEEKTINLLDIRSHDFRNEK